MNRKPLGDDQSLFETNENRSPFQEISGTFNNQPKKPSMFTKIKN